MNTKVLQGSVALAMLALVASVSLPADRASAQTPGVVVAPGPAVIPAPPPLPQARETQRAYTYPEGRYELRGGGTPGNPYYWVWIPTGVQSVPPPPPSPTSVQPSQSAYTFPEGRYELRGAGTPGSPYYWVWIPASTVAFAPGPGSQPALRSVSGQVDQIGFLGRSITLSDGQEFEVPDESARTNLPKVGQQVVVTYYVAPNGRNVAQSIEHSSVR